MTWVRIDDEFYRHPKVRAAGRNARDLQLAALQYCNRNLTDGRIPDYDLPLIAAEAMIPLSDVACAVESLLDTRHFDNPMWYREKDGFRIHDFDVYQPSREEVLADRKRNADRQRAFRDRQAGQGHAGPSPREHAGDDRAAPLVSAPAVTAPVSPPNSNAGDNSASNGQEEALFAARNGVTNGGTRIPYPESQNPVPTTTPKPPPSDAAPADIGTPPPDIGVVVASLTGLLTSWGVTESIAQDLARRRTPEQIRQQVEWFPSREAEKAAAGKPIRDPGAFLAKAIEGGYAPPPGWVQAKRGEAERARQAEQRREDAQRQDAQRQAKATGEARMSEAWAGLAEDHRRELTAEATARFSKGHKEHARRHGAALAADPETLPVGVRKLWRDIRDSLLVEHALIPPGASPPKDEARNVP